MTIHFKQIGTKPRDTAPTIANRLTSRVRTIVASTSVDSRVTPLYSIVVAILAAFSPIATHAGGRGQEAGGWRLERDESCYATS